MRKYVFIFLWINSSRPGCSICLFSLAPLAFLTGNVLLLVHTIFAWLRPWVQRKLTIWDYLQRPSEYSTGYCCSWYSSNMFYHVWNVFPLFPDVASINTWNIGYIFTWVTWHMVLPIALSYITVVWYCHQHHKHHRQQDKHRRCQHHQHSTLLVILLFSLLSLM